MDSAQPAPSLRAAAAAGIFRLVSGLRPFSTMPEVLDNTPEWDGGPPQEDPFYLAAELVALGVQPALQVWFYGIFSFNSRQHEQGMVFRECGSRGAASSHPASSCTHMCCVTWYRVW